MKQKKRQPFTWFDYVELPCAPWNYREFGNSSAFGGLKHAKLLFR